MIAPRLAPYYAGCPRCGVSLRKPELNHGLVPRHFCAPFFAVVPPMPPPDERDGYELLLEP